MIYTVLSQSKKVILALLVICLFTALSSPISITWAAESVEKSNKKTMPAIGAVSPPVAQLLINSLGTDLFILDVRTPREFSKGHIPKAVLIPHDTIAASLDQIPTDKPILILCKAGVRAKEAWEVIHSARPNQKDIWFINGKPKYNKDGSYTIN